MTHQATVWLLDARTLTAEALESFTSWLDDSERERLARFVRPARRRQFLAGRALARRALGSVLGLAPPHVCLAERPGTGPALALSRFTEAGFSISHSGFWIACAVSATCSVGLDVEVVDSSRNIEALAAQVFDEKQRIWLAARPSHTRVHDFYVMWSTLEASFKLGMTSAATFDLSRPDLSVVLCCENQLTTQPALQLVTLVD